MNIVQKRYKKLAFSISSEKIKKKRKSNPSCVTTERIFSKCLFIWLFSEKNYGFRKNHSAQQCLIIMIEKLRQSLDNGGASAALLTDFSKTFDCLPHDLLIAKLHAYDVELSSLRILHSYLVKRKQRVRLSNCYSLFMVGNFIWCTTRFHPWTASF